MASMDPFDFFNLFENPQAYIEREGIVSSLFKEEIKNATEKVVAEEPKTIASRSQILDIR